MDNPMSVFSEGVDRWGSAEWFDRLVTAVRAQDLAVIAKDDIGYETFRMIAASSAMTLVRDFEAEVRAALSNLVQEPVAWLRPGEYVPIQGCPFGAMWISDKDDPRAFPVYASAPRTPPKPSPEQTS